MEIPMERWDKIINNIFLKAHILGYIEKNWSH